MKAPRSANNLRVCCALTDMLCSDMTPMHPLSARG